MISRRTFLQTTAAVTAAAAIPATGTRTFTIPLKAELEYPIGASITVIDNSRMFIAERIDTYMKITAKRWIKTGGRDVDQSEIAELRRLNARPGDIFVRS